MLRGKVDGEFLKVMEGITQLSRNQVSQRAKFSNSVLYDLAQGKRNPTLETIDRLASVLWAECKNLEYIGENQQPGPLLVALGIHEPGDLWRKLIRVEVTKDTE